MLSQYFLSITFHNINVLYQFNKGQAGVYLDKAYSRCLVDRDTSGTVVKMVDNSGGQPDPNPAGMTYKKIPLSICTTISRILKGISMFFNPHFP